MVSFEPISPHNLVKTGPNDLKFSRNMYHIEFRKTLKCSDHAIIFTAMMLFQNAIFGNS